jgi:hypothetical protein
MRRVVVWTRWRSSVHMADPVLLRRAVWSIVSTLTIEHTRGVVLLHIVSLIAFEYDARECRCYVDGTCRFTLDVVPEVRSIPMELWMVKLPPLRLWILTVHGGFLYMIECEQDVKGPP